jgi:hypothetical protein
MLVTKRKTILIIFMYFIWLSAIILSLSPNIFSTPVFPQEVPRERIMFLGLSGILLSSYSAYLGYQEISS